MGRVEGKVALITGAARGQGRAEAKLLAREGADIIAVDATRDFETVPYPGATPEELRQLVADIRDMGRRIFAAQVDVRDYDGLATAVANGVSELGRLDIVVGNAGVLGNPGLCWELSEQEWQETIDINLTGVWHTAKATIPHLIKQGEGGSVIMTSSAGGLKASANISNYIASKFGVVGLVRSLAMDLAPYGIRANTVCPTNVNTHLIDNLPTLRLFRPDLDEPTLEDALEPLKGCNILPIPWVTVEDIAAAVLWLASDESRYVTGIALPVDAGMTQK